MKKDLEAKVKILNSAISLFACKGFGSVSVREITAHANVNPAMVSYYFNGKIGILKEIINRFFDAYETVIKDAILIDKPFEQAFREFIHSLVMFLKANKDLFKVAYYELPFDKPEVIELRGEKIFRIKKLLQGFFFSELDADNKTAPYLPILGPAVFSMIFSNFVLEPSLKAAFQMDFDDEFYETYAKTLSHFILKGINGFVDDLMNDAF